MFDMENTTLWKSNNSYQSRGPSTWKDKNRFFSLWPSFGFNSGDTANGSYTPIGQAEQNYGQFEPFSCDGDGTQSQNFLVGVCRDANNAIVANAVVQAFTTAGEVFAGTDISRDDGSYAVGVQQQKSTAHFLVAYKAGPPDISGTTVNTLLPTNVDGTP